MAAVAVAQRAVDLAQDQRRCLAHAVRPAQGAAANDKFALRKQPVRNRAVAAFGVFGNLQPADENFPVSLAPDIEFGAIDHQLLEAQPPERRGRQRAQHMRQAHRHAPLFVEQADIVQLERRNQSQRAGRDAADANRHPQRLTRLDLHARTKIADTRHNPAVKQPPAQPEQQPGADDEHQQPARRRRHPAQASGRRQGGQRRPGG